MGNFYNMNDNGMMSNWSNPFGFNWGFGGGLIFAPLILLLLAWTIYWKYQALWYAAKHDKKWWFLALLVVNTFGILEILYLYVFSKKVPGHDEKNVPMVPLQP